MRVKGHDIALKKYHIIEPRYAIKHYCTCISKYFSDILLTANICFFLFVLPN